MPEIPAFARLFLESFVCRTSRRLAAEEKVKSRRSNVGTRETLRVFLIFREHSVNFFFVFFVFAYRAAHP